MDVYTRMSDTDADDYDKLKKHSYPGTITQKMATERDSGRSSQRLKKRQTSSSFD